jgi:hypothetical protein
LETARSIEDKIAVAQAQAGNLAAALETARSIEDSWSRALALGQIVETMVKLGLK